MLCPFHFHFASIPCSHVKDFWKDPLAQHPNTSPPTPLKSHKSQTPLVHHFTPFSFTVSRPGATDPRPKHQALAPLMPISLRSKREFPKWMLVRVSLTANASRRACGQIRCQTMSNMRTYHAIFDNIQPCPLPHNWNQQTAEAKIARKYEEIRVNFSWKDVLSSAYWMGTFL